MSTTVELVTNRPGVRVVFRSENGIQILSRSVLGELHDVVKKLKADKTLRVVVFEAEGRTFLAGADLKELSALDRRSARRYSREGQRLFQRIADLSVTSICAIHAACAGGGCELALACDLRMAAAGARLGLPETTLGLIPGWGGTVRATLLLGPAAARRVILSGELFEAIEAARLGLVDCVISDEQFRSTVEDRVDRLLRGAPIACAAAKRLIRKISGSSLSELFDREAEEFARRYATAEPKEGLAAFLEKRPATWVGRETQSPSTASK